MVRGLAFRKKEESIISVFVFWDFPAVYSLMMEMRSHWDTYETEIRYDIEVTQDFGPQKHGKEEHSGCVRSPKESKQTLLGQAKHE